MTMKRSNCFLFALAGLALASSALMPQATAGEWDKKTVVTFNQPVEIPGQVLEPGTYTLTVINLLTGGGPDYIAVADETGQHIYRIVSATPVYHDNPFSWIAFPPEHTIITFEERTGNSPQAIKDWFYPGKLTGEEFIYPKLAPVQTPSEKQ